MAAFQGPFDIPFRPKMYKNKKAPFGAEQRLKNLLELLLIDMVRHGKSANQPKRNIGVSKNSISFHAVDQAIRYMEQNLESDITVDDLCKTLNLSKSTFKHIFKEVTGRPPIRYLIDLRITRAKQLIREENLNMTQIAASLGFHSVHYFSRYFKKATGLSPTQYANTVKSNLENLP
jgi:transcriptional regulator GlxA family with amidase domain